MLSQSRSMTRVPSYLVSQSVLPQASNQPAHDDTDWVRLPLLLFLFSSMNANRALGSYILPCPTRRAYALSLKTIGDDDEWTVTISML